MRIARCVAVRGGVLLLGVGVFLQCSAVAGESSASVNAAAPESDAKWEKMRQDLEALKRLLKPRTQQSASELILPRLIQECVDAYDQFGLSAVPEGGIPDLMSVVGDLESLATPCPEWLPQGSRQQLIQLLAAIRAEVYAE